MALASSTPQSGKRPPAWPMRVSRSPVLPNTRRGISPACNLLGAALAESVRPAAEEERNVLRRIEAPSVFLLYRIVRAGGGHPRPRARYTVRFMSYVFRQAICNEAFDKWPFADACKTIRQAGYTGIEIAPFTLAEDPASVTAAQRREYRDIIANEGLQFVGLHWLMVSPKGLHVTTPDAQLRARSWQHIRNLIDLCADLGPSGVMVFGSPFQRATTGGATRERATRHYVEGLAAVAPQAQERGVTILIE